MTFNTTLALQHTIKSPVLLNGIGLHSGQTVTLRFLPTPVNTGIIFKRIDLSPPVTMPARAVDIQETLLSTSLMHGEHVRISTIEHLMSALAGLKIDNVLIELNAAEVPIMDGSAAPFVKALQQVGLVAQEQARQFLKIMQPVRVELGDKYAEFLPHDGFKMTFSIDFAHPVFADEPQQLDVELTADYFLQHISRARTFGFLKDIDQLRSQNLALGGSLENAIVLDETTILNPEGLRFKGEFLSHKMLDALGDLYLAGYPILGNFRAHKTGHTLNNMLVRKMLATPECYQLTAQPRPEC